MNASRGILVLAVLLGLAAGAGPLGVMWWQARARAIDAEGKLATCSKTIEDAAKASTASMAKAADLARRPLKEIAEEAQAVPSVLTPTSADEVKVTALETGQPAPYPGALYGRVKAAEAARALRDMDSWALDVARLEREAKAAQDEADKTKDQLKAAKAKTGRWIRKGISLTAGSAVAAWGLAKEKPWIAGAGLTVGVVGAIIF